MTLQEIWKEFQSYDGTGSKNFEVPGCRVQFYKGAMEIPLVAFYPKSPFTLGAESMEGFSALLEKLGFELDCVEEGGNYKINRSEDGQYLGRITNEALKLHAERIKELGWDAFQSIADFHLSKIQAAPK